MIEKCRTVAEAIASTRTLEELQALAWAYRNVPEAQKPTDAEWGELSAKIAGLMRRAE